MIKCSIIRNYSLYHIPRMEYIAVKWFLLKFEIIWTIFVMFMRNRVLNYIHIVKPSYIYKIMWKNKYVFLKKWIKIFNTMLNLKKDKNCI